MKVESRSKKCCSENRKISIAVWFPSWSGGRRGGQKIKNVVESLYEITRYFMLCHKFAEMFYEKKAAKSMKQEMIKFKWSELAGQFPVYDDFVFCRKVSCWIIIVQSGPAWRITCNFFLSTSTFLAWSPRGFASILNIKEVLGKIRRRRLHQEAGKIRLETGVKYRDNEVTSSVSGRQQTPVIFWGM